MNILIFVKPVLEKYVNNSSNNGENWVINPYDLYALSSIVTLKSKNENIHITCISMGPMKAKEVLVRCRAIGADEVILLSDPVFRGSDTYATTCILEHAVRKVGYFSLIVCGKQTVDGETGQVGYGLAYRLGIPCFAQVNEIFEISDNIEIVKETFPEEKRKEQLLKYKGIVTFLYRNEGYEKIIQTPLPVMLIMDTFMTQKNVSLLKLKKAIKKPITIWNHEVLGADISICGSNGSKTEVLNVASSIEKKKPIVIEGTIAEKATKLISILTNGNRR